MTQSLEESPSPPRRISISSPKQAHLTNKMWRLPSLILSRRRLESLGKWSRANTRSIQRRHLVWLTASIANLCLRRRAAAGMTLSRWLWGHLCRQVTTMRTNSDSNRLIRVLTPHSILARSKPPNQNVSSNRSTQSKRVVLPNSQQIGGLTYHLTWRAQRLPSSSVHPASKQLSNVNNICRR